MAGVISRHDLEDMRRRVCIDRRDVMHGQLRGEDILEGVIDMLTNLLLKLDGKPYVDGRGYRHAGEDGSWPIERE